MPKLKPLRVYLSKPINEVSDETKERFYRQLVRMALKEEAKTQQVYSTSTITVSNTGNK